MSEPTAATELPLRRSTAQKLRRLAMWLGPYVIAAAVITLLLRRYSISQIHAEMQRGAVAPLFPVALVAYVISLGFVVAADRWVLGRLMDPAEPPGYLAMARGKAASVLLHIVHYALGQGAYATWLARRSGLRVAKAGGLILYIVASELGSVTAYAAAVILVARPTVPSAVLPSVLGAASAVVGFVLLVPSTRLDRFALFETFRRVGRARGVGQIGVRLFQHATTTSATWIAARAFGLDIPLGVMLAYMPVILVVGSLPINVAGFGAVQGAWLLLTPWAPAERVLAFSVVWQAVSALALIVRGLPFLRGVLRDIAGGEPSATPS